MTDDDGREVSPGTSEEPDPRRIAADPAKRFFVAMLVKDIELVPAILDLVDNSVDGAKRLVQGRDDPTAVAAEDSARFDGLFVHVTVDGARFEINDNCGGISLDAARSYAFRFGRPETVEGPLGEVGQFGVGMKRALFKLGTRFEVTCFSRSDSFTLPVDVPVWMREPTKNWSFELSDFEEGLDLPDEKTGTNIEVAPLHPTIAEETGDPLFAPRLRAELELRHAEAVRRGLELKVNGHEIEGFEPSLLVGPEFAPIHEVRVIDAGDGDPLRMRLYAGLVRLREDERDLDEGQAEEFRAPPEAGWYLYCNDRLLLAADRTRLTGWGHPGAAAYHPQYRQFRGYVLLDGDAALMPWTTTKTDVDEDSKVFRTVQAVMFDALKKTQAVINRLKAERSGFGEGGPQVRAMRGARPQALSSIERSQTFLVPRPAPKLVTPDRSITYRVDKEDFTAVRNDLGASSAAEVGRRTFDFYLETQVRP